MPLCRVCIHPQRAAIDAALIAHQSGYRGVAKRFHVSQQSVYRHQIGHLPVALREAKVQMDTDALTARLLALDAYVDRVLQHSEQRGDDRTVLLGVAQGRGTVEMLAKLGPLSDIEQRLAALEAGGESDPEGSSDDPTG